ncbi:MAG: Wzt carbohydrate-binding domain-containing protein, partial [bacterium]
PGEPMTIRIHYRLEVALPQASVSVTTYRLDGVVVLNAISSLDATDLTLSAGSGAVDLVFDRLLLGPGEYMVAVGIYPALDLGDPISPQHAVIWHRPVTFTVQQPVGVALDLGVVMHPARWRIARPQEVRDASSANAP